ncbi:MAG TPA: BACON domain-containing carbohydrate-binding protein, partial [Niabella sp.]|nr:BACON domain-containing carbohydrate-binding protein [Niabella sp.]
LKLGQRGLITPKIAITATSVAPAAAGGTVSTAIDASLPLNKMSLSFSESGNTWISDLAIVDNNLTFNVAPNTTAAARTAKIYLNYVDLLGTVAKDSLAVNQARP